METKQNINIVYGGVLLVTKQVRTYSDHYILALLEHRVQYAVTMHAVVIMRPSLL